MARKTRVRARTSQSESQGPCDPHGATTTRPAALEEAQDKAAALVQVIFHRRRMRSSSVGTFKK